MKRQFEFLALLGDLGLQNFTLSKHELKIAVENCTRHIIFSFLQVIFKR